MDLVRLLSGPGLIIYLLVAVRTTTAITVSPLATMPGVPASVRVLLGLVIALAFVYGVPTAVPADRLQLSVTNLGDEAALGLLVGTASTLVVSAVRIAAGWIDFQASFTFATSIDPLSEIQTGPIDRFMGAFGAVLFFDLDGHHLFLLALDDLFRSAPVGGPFQLAQPQQVTGLFSAVFLVALAMALPVITLVLVADVVLALLSRAAPQFNLFAVGMPVRTGMTLVVLALLLPLTTAQISGLLQQLPVAIRMVTQASAVSP